MNRLSADGSILLKNGTAAAGYGGSAGYLPQTASPAFQQQHQSHPAHPSLLHHQSQPALMMNGKSPSRDLGGGSTPVLKTAAHTTVGVARGDNNATTQVILTKGLDYQLLYDQQQLTTSRL